MGLLTIEDTRRHGLAALSPKTFLVVPDPVRRDEVQDLLGTLGFASVVAGDDPTGQGSFASDPSIRLALVDIRSDHNQLADLRTLREIATHAKQAGVRVVIAVDDDLPRPALLELLRLGIADYIGKPVRPSELAAVIDKELRAADLFQLATAKFADGGPPTRDPAGHAADPPHQDPLRLLVELERVKARYRIRLKIDEIEFNMLIDLAWSAVTDRKLTVTALAHGSGAPLATAHRRLRNLERQELVRRQKDLHDRRQVHLALTDKGRRAVDGLLSDLTTLIAPL